MLNEQLSFLDKYPAGIYKMQINAPLEGELLYQEFESIFNTHLSYIQSNPAKDYIQTPKEFFQRWLNGHLNKVPNLDNICKGFELQLPQVKIQKFENGKVHGRVEGLVIASDFDYSGNFGNDLVFAINDVSSEKVLTYHDEKAEQLKINPLEMKRFTNKTIYGHTNRSEKFPFESLNPNKSMPYTWSLIHILPNEVYQALREIGFKW